MSTKSRSFAEELTDLISQYNESMNNLNAFCDRHSGELTQLNGLLGHPGLALLLPTTMIEYLQGRASTPSQPKQPKQPTGPAEPPEQMALIKEKLGKRKIVRYSRDNRPRRPRATTGETEFWYRGGLYVTFANTNPEFGNVEGFMLKDGRKKRGVWLTEPERQLCVEWTQKYRKEK
jgi:hypothetical protein